MDLTTISSVKQATGNESSTTDDSLLQLLITQVSARFARYLGRHIDRIERTEDYSIRAGARLITMRGTPVDETKTFTLLASSTRDFSNAQSYVANQDFVLEPELGLVTLHTLPTVRVAGFSGVPVSPAWCRVTYTGGFAETIDELASKYADLVSACTLQVAYLYRRKDSPGSKTVKMGQSESMHDQEYQLLAEAKQVLDSYRRMALA